MKTGKWQKKWAAIFLALVLMINMLFNHSSFLTVFAEDAPEATTEKVEKKEEKTEKKEEKTEKKEEKTEEKKEEKTEEKKEESQKKEDSSDQSKSSGKEDGSSSDKKENKTEQDSTDKAVDAKKEENASSEKKESSSEKDNDVNKTDSSDDKKTESTQKEEKKDAESITSEKEESKEEDSQKEDKDDNEDNKVDTSKITIDGSKKLNITVKATVEEEDGSEKNVTKTGSDIVFDNAVVGTTLTVEAGPKKDNVYISSVSGAISAGKQEAGANLKRTLKVPAQNAKININGVEMETGISNLFSVSGKKLNIDFNKASANQYKEYTKYNIDGVSDGWKEIPDNHEIEIAQDGNYKLQLGHNVNEEGEILSNEAGFTIDTIGPVFDESMLSPDAWLNASGTFKIPVRDETSNLSEKLTWTDDLGNQGEVNSSSLILDAEKILEGIHIYTFTATDTYGNSTIKSATLKKDTSIPSFQIIPAIEEKWYNKDTVFKVIAENTANFEGNNSGIASVAVNGDNIDFSKQTSGDYAGKYVGEFSPKEGNNAENSISVISGAGIENTGTQKILYDGTPINSDVKIKYFVEKNNYNNEDLIDNTDEISQGKIGNKSSRIIVQLYIKDDLSGVRDSYSVSYGEGKSLNFTKNSSGLTSDGRYRLTADDSVRGNQIQEVTNAIAVSHDFFDVAGNPNDDLTLIPENDPMDLFDDKAPILNSVTLGTYKEEFGAFFNTKGIDITPSFVIEEENSWLNEVIGTPDYTFDINPGAPGLSNNDLSYSKATSQNHTMTAKSILDTPDETETKYTLAFSYLDGSGNKLVKGGEFSGNVAEGKYTADVIIDKKAPEIKVSLSDAEVNHNNGNVVLHGEGNNAKEFVKNGYQFQLAVNIKESYLDKNSIIIRAENAIDSTKSKDFQIDSSDLTKNADDSFTVVKELLFDSDGEYRLVVKASDISSNEGKANYQYPIVIDTEAPKVAIVHSVIGNGSTFENRTLYAKDYSATLEITDNTPVDNNRVDINSNIESDSGFSYIGSKSGVFNLQYNTENPNNEARNYTVSYSDLSGNKLDFAENGESGDATNGEPKKITGNLNDGVYTSPDIYIDTTAPTINALKIINVNDDNNYTVSTENGNKRIYLRNNPSLGSVKLKFSLDELFLKDNSVMIDADFTEDKLPASKSEGNPNSFENTFDNRSWPEDELGKIAEYHFALEASDKAGNELDWEDAKNSNAKEILNATAIIKDTKGPELTVNHMPDNAGTFEAGTPGTIYTKSYSAILEIKEANYVETEGDDGAKLAKLTMDGNDSYIEKTEQTSKSVSFMKGTPDPKDHDSYTVYYVDPSGNGMQLNEETTSDDHVLNRPNKNMQIQGTNPSKENNWTYTSPKIIIDNTAPVIQNPVFDEGHNTRLSIPSDKIYLYNKEKRDATLKFKYLEHYPDNNTVTLKAGMKGNLEKKDNPNSLQTNLSLDNDGAMEANHNTSFTYTFNSDSWDETVKEGDFNYKAQATDKAGNISDEWISDTTIVIDRVNPVLTPYFMDAVTTLNRSLRPGQGDKTELFYKAQPKISLTLTEHNYVQGQSEVKYALQSAKTDNDKWTDAESSDKLNMKGDGDDRSYLVEVTPEDCHDYFTVSYTDFSGNEMVMADDYAKQEDYSGTFEGNVYTSPIITRDNTAPVIKTTFNGTPKYPNDSTSADRDKSTRYYYQNNQTMTIIVTEENFIPDEDGKIKYSVYNFDNDTKNKIDNKDISWNANYTYTADGKKQFKGTIKFDEEWNYKIKTDVTDRCNQTAATSDNITIDGTKPYISIQDIENTSKSDVTYHNNTSTGSLSDFFDYRLFGYFHKNLMRVKITAHDKTSGVYRIKYVITHENGTITSGEWKFDSPAESQTEYITIPVNAKDRIEITPIDFSQVTGNKVNPRGGVSETQDYHDANSTMSIKINTAPSNTVGKMKYFKTAVNATITMKDGHAGIRSYEYTAGTAVSGSHNYGNDAGDKDKKGDPGTSIKYEETFNPTMAAGDTNYTNRANPTVIKASFTDNVGHSSKAEEKIVIDNKAPVIKVAWNSSVQPMNKKYYRATRTATITVNERNFNDKGVKWKINNMKGVNISGWSHNGDTNTCTVAFTQDGDDFLLDFDITDYAMNKASCPKQETFTIDKTAPVISITYDNNNASNGFYFNRARTATLHVQEHNFQASDVKYEMTASNDGHGISNPGVGGWSMGSDHHTASIGYNTDGEYSLNFNYTDMAGNPANKLSTDKFVIDLTKPAVKIINVEDHKAYNGKITPGVEYSDTNLDESQLSIKMIGNKVGNTDNNKNYNRNNSRNIHNGRVIEWSDFKRKAEVDDIYTFEVVAKDKAGNTNEPAKVTFSVNRFGSNYIFGQQTEELLTKEHPYTNEEIPIEVTEINVTQLKEKAVSIQDENNNIRELAEGTDYKVTEGSDKYKWKEYSYLIDKENFVNEGQYTVTLSSVDGAENKMNNITKKKEIEFVIDKTNPTGTVSGLEEDHYQEDSHDITLRANDNYGLQGGELYVGGTKVGEYDGAMLTAAEGVTETLTSSNEPQKVQMKVFDWAGNEEIIDPLNGNGVLVNASWFIQWFNQKPLFYGSLGGAAAVVLGVVGVLTKGFGYSASMASGTGFWWLIFGKRRRDDEEE